MNEIKYTNGLSDVPHEPEQPNKVTRLFNYFAIVALVVVAIAIGVFIKWSLQGTDVLQIKNNPFPARVISDPTGRTGGVVFLNVDYCKKQDLKGTVRTSYVSASREIFLPSAKEQIPVGCNKQDLPVVIPLGLLKDTYKIKFHVVYDINPVKQNIFMDFESQPFLVGSTNMDQ